MSDVIDIPAESLQPFGHCHAHGIGEKIEAIERLMKQRPQVEIPPTHYFAPGLYARSIVIPKGVLATGKVHLDGYLIVIPYGDVTVRCDEGVKRIHGPAVFTAQAGMKHIGFAHEETMWICVHRAEAKTAEEAEKELVVETLAEYRALKGETPWPSLPQPSSAE